MKNSKLARRYWEGGRVAATSSAGHAKENEMKNSKLEAKDFRELARRYWEGGRVATGICLAMARMHYPHARALFGTNAYNDVSNTLVQLGWFRTQDKGGYLCTEDGENLVSEDRAGWEVRAWACLFIAEQLSEGE